MGEPFFSSELEPLKIDREDPSTWPVHRIYNTDGWVIWKGCAPDDRHAIEQALQAGLSMHNAYFAHCDLSGMSFMRSADFSGAYFAYSNLSNAVFYEANLQGAVFRGADMTGTEFIGCAPDSL